MECNLLRYFPISFNINKVNRMWLLMHFHVGMHYFLHLIQNYLGLSTLKIYMLMILNFVRNSRIVRSMPVLSFKGIMGLYFEKIGYAFLIVL